jgi:MoaA/NifB/PqqE/SkfB family radical SAM enzyme
VVSNGYLLDERRLEGLLKSGMHSIAISLDGLEAEHNWMRQTVGSFDRASRAIGLLGKTRGLLWDVVTCVNPRNYGQLEEM